MGLSDCGLRRTSRLVLACAVILVAPALCAVAQAQQPSSAAAESSAGAVDLAEGFRLLQVVRDNVFSFDDPAFYWFCRYVRERPETLDVATNGAPLSWRFLAERPGDYRGRAILVEGVLQSRQSYEVANRPGVGLLHQCELSDPTTRGICTVVVIDDPAAVPMRSLVRASGYFIKVRSYKTTTRDSGAGPLLVAKAISPAPSESQGQSSSSPLSRTLSSGRCSWVAWGTALLAVVWLALLRRSRQLRGRDTASKVQSAADGATESNGDFDWLSPSDQDRRGG